MKTRYCLVSLLFLLVVVSADVYGQQYTVKGTVTASGVPVRNAIVTFIDGYNTSTKYTAETDSTGAFTIGAVTGVKSSPRLPASFQLEQNYPNPFASKTAISYNLDRKSDVKVTIYDVLGRVVKRYSLGYQDAGVHGIIWNGRNMLDRRVAPGVYFCRLQARGRSEVRKMLFGIGAPHASVSLNGLLPSGTTGSRLAKAASLQSEPFTVVITNTDSTSPFIVAGQVYTQYVRIGSDTTLPFLLQKLNPAIVYTDSAAQLIEGFGGANTVNWQDHNFSPTEINQAFGDAPGDIGLTIMRMRIPPDSSQFVWSVPTAKQAESLGAKVIASPWTPPYWMKTNDNIAGGYLDSLDYGAYAAHLRGFADTMAANGAPVYAISVQNEPDANVNYESCYWTPTEFVRFMRDYAPSVGVPVFMPESEGFNHIYSDPTLNDSLACAHTAFIAGHLYGASPSVYSLALNKGKQVWMTEYLDTATTWASDLSTAKQINDCMTADMSAYVWWWTIDDWSLIGSRGNITSRGYVMSQYARFVRPGYYRVYTTVPSSPNTGGLYWTAYTGNNKTVIVVINDNSFSTVLPFMLKNSSVTSFTPYVTSSSKDCLEESSVTVGNGELKADLDASSVTTFVSN